MRLEKNVTSKSRQTFQQGGQITSVVMLEASHCVASASTNGTIWIHRVDVGLNGTMPKYSKPALIRQHRVDEKEDFVTCLSSYNTGKQSLSDSIYSLGLMTTRLQRRLAISFTELRSRQSRFSTSAQCNRFTPSRTLVTSVRLLLSVSTTNTSGSSQERHLGP